LVDGEVAFVYRSGWSEKICAIQPAEDWSVGDRNRIRFKRPS